MTICLVVENAILLKDPFFLSHIPLTKQIIISSWSTISSDVTLAFVTMVITNIETKPSSNDFHIPHKMNEKRTVAVQRVCDHSPGTTWHRLAKHDSTEMFKLLHAWPIHKRSGAYRHCSHKETRRRFSWRPTARLPNKFEMVRNNNETGKESQVN